jgi:hypothetical protein
MKRDWTTFLIEIFFSLDRLRKYSDETVVLQLPGDLNIFQIDWLSVFDLETKQSFGSVIIPDNLNVPPSLVTVIVSIKIYILQLSDSTSFLAP